MFTFHTLSGSSYQDQRFQFLLHAEESGDPKELPYLDNQDIPTLGIPTIGIGFNLREDFVLDEILRTFGVNQLDPVDVVYANQIVAIVSATHASDNDLQSDLDAVMAARAIDPNVPGAGKRPTFEFTDAAEIRSVFDNVILEFETSVENWLPGIPDSQERVALVSLAYNSPSLLVAT